ncbi:hypothetical protein BDV18DRAFT_136233 [Aspergillus unguis]
MSGNYDHPPASRRTTRPSRPNDRIRPNADRLQHLRDLLTTERNRNTSARALDTLNQEIEHFRSEHARDRAASELNRVFVDQGIRDLHGERFSREDHTQGARSGAGLRLQNLQNLDAVMDHGPSPSELSRSINRAPRSRALRGGDRTGRSRRNRDSILDQPIPRSDSPYAMPLEPDRGNEPDRSRVKRRKLDSDDTRKTPQTMKYGHHGQVVPGTLKMELASCDGGTYEPVCESSGPENILTNDSTVYCTKSDRCNLILKHRGEAPFCLKKLVIKAPKSGYDAPIQAGMVFVAMSADELLARTAQYQVHSGSRAPYRRRRGGQLSEEYLNSYRTPLQTLERATLARFGSHSDSDTDTSELPGVSSSQSTEQTPEFRVATEYDERSDGAELGTLGSSFLMPQTLESGTSEMIGTIYPPVEDEFLCSESDDSSSDEDNNPETDAYNSRRRDLQRQVRAMRRQHYMEQDVSARNRHIPNIIQPIAPSALSEPHPGSNARSLSTGLMKPLAQFFIKRPKSSVSLNFDPPPSGRYILIKLWSPYNAGNIDIQSVIAYGYAGPRFFPAAAVR